MLSCSNYNDDIIGAIAANKSGLSRDYFFMTLRKILNVCSLRRYSRAICKNWYHKSGKPPLPGTRVMAQRIETAAVALGADRGGVQRDKRQGSARARVERVLVEI